MFFETKKTITLHDVTLDDARELLEAYRAEYKAAVAQLALVEDSLTKSRVAAPVSGVIQRRLIAAGDFVLAFGGSLGVGVGKHLVETEEVDAGRPRRADDGLDRRDDRVPCTAERAVLRLRR